MNIGSATDLGHCEPRDLGAALQFCDDDLLVHDANHISIIATLQQQSCKKQTISSHANCVGMTGLESDTAFIKDLCEWAKLKPSQLANAAGLTPTTILRPFKGEATTRLSQPTLDKLKAKFPKFPGWRSETSDQMEVDAGIAYESVEVLPTFGGMGGGGTGDGDPETALVPRALIRDILRGAPADFLLINVRGDSMEPDFHHGDQILVDRRDTSPAQPGPFALWDGEWGEYVVKNVERSRAGEVRIFSSNPKYSAENAGSEQTRIIGRPVWFGRRL